MSQTPPRSGPSVIVAGGGTGGHLYPGIAVAREILRRAATARVSFAGTAHGLEATIVPREGFDLDVIRSAGLKGKSLAARLRGLALVPPGLLDAWRLISKRQPDVVVGVGGYSSGPVVLVAALRGIPTMVLEQNAVPGLANRLLARFVRQAAVTYAETLPHFRGRGFVAGNPVRAEFHADTATGVAGGAGGTRVLILGGSLGAHALNMAAVAAAPQLAREHPGLQIVHQTGTRDLDAVRQEYARHDISVRAEAFLHEMADEMRAADVVFCRAGATTLAELAAVGRPAVLVPFPHAADDHQRRNARVLAEAGAAVVIEDADLDAVRVAGAIGRLLGDRATLARMGTAMKTFARPGAAAAIVDRLLAMAGTGARRTAR